MARPGRPERNRAARSFRQLRRFHRGFNSDNVFGTHTDKFCAARAKLVGIRTAAEQATAGINHPDRCQLAKGVCGAILFCAMMASARARFSSRRWLVKTRK